MKFLNLKYRFFVPFERTGTSFENLVYLMAMFCSLQRIKSGAHGTKTIWFATEECQALQNWWTLTIWYAFKNFQTSLRESECCQKSDNCQILPKKC